MTSPKEKEKEVIQTHDGNVIIMDSVAQFSPEETGRVVVAGSHGSAPAARHAAQFLPFGLILNDAGRGKNNAGISGLPLLDAMEIMGATVDCMSARIGEGKDTFEAGVISTANAIAENAGVRVGMSVVEAANLMLAAKKTKQKRQGAFVIHEGKEGRIILADTISYLNDNHRGSVVVAGSHCSHTTYDWVKDLELRGIFLNDAGKGKDCAGISGLSIYQSAAMPAGAVDCMTAMIGHGRDAWENGILSVVNEAGQGLGLTIGMSVQQAALKVLKARR